MKNKLIKILLTTTIFLTTILLIGCQSPTHEQHINNISTRVEQRFINNANYEHYFTDFEVTLAKNPDGDVEFFVVDFLS